MANKRKQPSQQQRDFVEYVVQGATISEAAKRAGVNRCTASGWFNHSPLVKGLIEKRANEIRKAAMTRGKLATEAAVETLVEITTDREAAHRDRINAAKEILDRFGIPKVTVEEVSGRNGGPIDVRSWAHEASDRELLEVIGQTGDGFDLFEHEDPTDDDSE